MTSYSLSPSTRNLIRNALIYIILILLAGLMIFPFTWLLSTALKDPAQVYARPPVLLPRPIRWENLLDVMFPERLFGKSEYYVLPFPQMLNNTVLIAVLSTVGAVVSASFVGYGFARLRFPGRDLLFAVLLSTMMVPIMVRMVPLYLVYRRLKWIDTFYPLIVPSYFGGAFDIFLVRQYCRTIPSEYADAAKIDGCSELGVWWRIIVPMTWPVLTVVGIRAFQGAWGSFTMPLILLHSAEKKTLMLGLNTLLNVAEAAYHYQMSAAVITTIPLIVLFFAFQRYFFRGITISGVKG